jgi:hypothetical protein
MINKETVKTKTKEWAPKLAFSAVAGFTGLAAVALYRTYKHFDRALDSAFKEDLPKDNY